MLAVVDFALHAVDPILSNNRQRSSQRFLVAGILNVEKPIDKEDVF